MPFTISSVTSTGDFFPGITAAVITTSLSATTLPSSSRCFAVKCFVLRFRVSAGVLRILRPRPAARRSVRPGSGPAPSPRPQIVSGRHRAQPPRRRDRLQSRDARADHQNTRGRDRSRRRGQHGKNSRQGVRRHQHRFIPAKSSPSTRARPCSERAWFAASTPPQTQWRPFAAISCTVSVEPSGRRNPIRHLLAPQQRHSLLCPFLSFAP